MKNESCWSVDNGRMCECCRWGRVADRTGAVIANVRVGVQQASLQGRLARARVSACDRAQRANHIGAYVPSLPPSRVPNLLLSDQLLPVIHYIFRHSFCAIYSSRCGGLAGPCLAVVVSDYTKLVSHTLLVYVKVSPVSSPHKHRQ